MSDKGTDFLFGCKNLYLASIHPFDFEKSNLSEYKQLTELGKELLEQRGLKSFVGHLMENQYRVAVWASMIIVEYGKPKQTEMLPNNKNRSIIVACSDCIMKDEIEPLPAKIIENRKNWAQKNVPQQRI